MQEMRNGTVQGLLGFLENLKDKGRLSVGQVSPLKIAVTKVVSTVDGDTWLQTNVRDIDIDDYMRRFINKTDTFYTEQSLSTYRSRLARVQGWYLNFINNPGWTPDVNKSRPVKNKTGSAAAKPSKPVSAPLPTPTAEHATNHVSQAQELITYPFPLSTGQLVRLSLPAILPVTEARRLSAFIQSLAIDTDHTNNGERQDEKT